jgi:hypothetical protein
VDADDDAAEEAVANAIDEFLADVPASWGSRVAPLCTFAGDREGRLWSAAAVFRCAGENDDADAATAEQLRAAGVGYFAVPAAWFDNGLLTTPAFKQVVDQILSNAGPADPESFLSAPRPIYPPRSRVLRD